MSATERLGQKILSIVSSPSFSRSRAGSSWGAGVGRRRGPANPAIPASKNRFFQSWICAGWTSNCCDSSAMVPSCRSAATATIGLNDDMSAP